AAVSEKAENLRDVAEAVKQAFYKIQHTDHEPVKTEIEEAQADETAPAVPVDEQETELKQLLSEYKKIRAEQLAGQEQERVENQKKKEGIIERMKQLTEDEGDVMQKMSEFKQLQQQWNEIGAVPPTVSNDLWKKYNLYREQFYDQVKISNELRDYDFKKNLEIKTSLVQAAEQLAERADVVAAFRELQDLHAKWKETGPVAREIREEIWAKFKEASTVINKKHQDFFDKLHEREEENYQKKTELCEQLEQIDLDVLTSNKKWDEMTQQVFEVQKAWRSIGFAPRKVNQQIYDRYRVACDRFFEAKTEFFKQVKAVQDENLAKKTALCEQAEALNQSSEWKQTTDKLVELQKEWKTIGPTAHKYSEAVWKRFQTACDTFFERKKAQFAGKHEEEQHNLVLKRELIEKIENLNNDADNETTLATLRELMAEYNMIGHVPFSEKEKLYKRYRAAVDKQFDALHVDAEKRRIDTFRSNLEDMSKKGGDRLSDERRKLMRVYETLKQEIATSENNIGFFSSKSKGSNALIDQMKRKIDSLKAELKTVAEKISIIDEKL
ncbi:MAG: DUF349 domain-containing protein, partial [Paludibacteraceae bacterium]|nr:DUF349 domain-containing protein [Paludibacteraceae bacterium]